MDFIRKNYLFLTSLVCVALLLLWANYLPGTYLSGWDNIQTELNPGLGVKRAFYSVWEEYQSMGLLAGMGHGADLLRAVGVLAMSWIVPTSMIRYLEHFGMIVFGALGMYVLLYTGLRDEHERVQKLSAWLGGLFYILNYGTVQIFSVPLEAFSIFLGFLPWLVWSFLKYIHSQSPGGRSKRYLVLLFVLNVLATPFAYIQTLFVVYGMVLGLVWITELAVAERRADTLKKGLIAGFLIVGINLYWLLPQAYFVLSGGTAVVKQAKINQLATEDVNIQNQAAGTLGNFVKMRGFYSDLKDTHQKPLFAAWNQHFDTAFGTLLAWAMFAIILFGFTRKSVYRHTFRNIFLLSAVVWLSPTPEVGKQIFRSPFTKFISVYALAASYLFASGAARIMALVGASHKKFHITVLGLIFLLLVYAFPAFTGHYVTNDMRVNIPQDYLDTIEYFKTVDPNQRIALMPDYTFWGWFFTNWGYNGSGFLWYGIEQPIVSRTFDVWGAASESYFWEMKTALEAEDVPQMERVLEKYAIDYLIVDHSLVPVASGIRALQYDRLKNMLSQSSKVKQFGFGKQISLYRFTRDARANQFVSLAGELPSAGPYVPFMSKDQVVGPYITYENAPNDTFYPFRNLFSQTRLYDDQWALHEYEKSFIFIARTPQDLDATAITQLQTPFEDETAQLFINNKEQTFASHPSYEFDPLAHTLSTTIPKSRIATIKPESAAIHNCGDNENISDRIITRSKGLLRVFSNNKMVPCMVYDLPFLNQKYSYILSVKTRSIEGERLFMALTDKTKGQPYIEDRLQKDKEYFVINPRYTFGQGYTLTFQNTSFMGFPSTNVIDEISVYLLPAGLSKAMWERPLEDGALDDTGSLADRQLVAPSTVSKRAYHAYSIDLSADELASQSYVVLHQAYHPGWHAYVVAHDAISQYLPMLAGRQLSRDEHVRFNTWAQAWHLPEVCEKHRPDCRIVLVFWPQYLQWFGFVILGGIAGGILAVAFKRGMNRD